jgi:DNA-binding IclR family transcriptional regulator
VKTQPSGTVLKAVDVLTLFERRPAISPVDCARLLHLPVSTAHRQLATLFSAGLLESDGTGIYRLSVRVFQLGCSVPKPALLADAAHHVIQPLAQRTGMVVHVALEDACQVVYVAKQGGRYVQVPTKVGMRGPIHATALGKAIMATWSEEHVESVLAHELPRYTARTIVQAPKLLCELRHIRDEGIATDNEERLLGIRCMAATVKDPVGVVVGAISLVHRTDEPVSRLKAARADLRESAGQIGRSLQRRQWAHLTRSAS